ATTARTSRFLRRGKVRTSDTPCERTPYKRGDLRSHGPSSSLWNYVPANFGQEKIRSTTTLLRPQRTQRIGPLSEISNGGYQAVAAPRQARRLYDLYRSK